MVSIPLSCHDVINSGAAASTVKTVKRLLVGIHFQTCTAFGSMDGMSALQAVAIRGQFAILRNEVDYINLI